MRKFFPKNGVLFGPWSGGKDFGRNWDQRGFYKGPAGISRADALERFRRSEADEAWLEVRVDRGTWRPAEPEDMDRPGLKARVVALYYAHPEDVWEPRWQRGPEEPPDWVLGRHSRNHQFCAEGTLGELAERWGFQSRVVDRLTATDVINTARALEPGISPGDAASALGCGVDDWMSAAFDARAAVAHWDATAEEGGRLQMRIPPPQLEVDRP